MIAIIGILVSIAVTVGRGVQERAKIAQAKAEMAVLAAALEAYRAQYGDYPWTPDSPPTGAPNGWDGGMAMFNALTGNLRVKGDGPLLDEDGQPRKGRAFVELTKFTLDSDLPANIPDPENPTLVRNWFNDPWGGWYWYHYRKGLPGTAAGDEWKSPKFLLYSHGPDGACFLGTGASAPQNSGIIDGALPESEPYLSQNADNIYYGRY